MVKGSPVKVAHIQAFSKAPWTSPNPSFRAPLNHSRFFFSSPWASFLNNIQEASWLMFCSPQPRDKINLIFNYFHRRSKSHSLFRRWNSQRQASSLLNLSTINTKGLVLQQPLPLFSSNIRFPKLSRISQQIQQIRVFSHKSTILFNHTISLPIAYPNPQSIDKWESNLPTRLKTSSTVLVVGLPLPILRWFKTIIHQVDR